MLNAVERLGQTRYAGSGFQVAQVALYRANQQRRFALLAECFTNRTGFNRVANGGAGAVGFQVVDFIRRDARLFIGALH